MNLRSIVLFLFLLSFLEINGQVSISTNNDTLVNSLKSLIAELNLNDAHRTGHYLVSQDYNYYRSINSLDLVVEVRKVLSKISLPFEECHLNKISLVKCYDWTEAYSTWFITIIDKFGNHYIYFYENNKGIDKIKLYAESKERDYFHRLGKNLYKNKGCKQMNEDFIVMCEIVDEKFISYFSSQNYTGMDLIIFNDLLSGLSN